MADVLWKVFETAVSLFESCVVIYFICSLLQHSFKSINGKLIYMIGIAMDFICVNIINNHMEYESIFGTAYIIIYLAFSIVFLKGTFIQKVFASVIANSVLVCTVSIVTGIMSGALKNDYLQIYTSRSIYRAVAMIMNQFILILIFNIILKYKVITIKKHEWRLILSILGISFVSLALIHFAVIETDIEPQYSKFLMLSEFGIIFLNIVCFYMTYSLSKSNSEAEELRIKNQQEEYRLSYAENIKNQYEEIRRMRHDMKQDLAVLSELYREQKYDEARSFADKVSKNLAKFDNVIDVQNVFINAILNSKLSTALEYGIKVICSSSNNVSGIDDIDLCNLLGNMLDNAIEAAKMCEMGYIEVSINSDENKILVIIANSVVKSVLNYNKELITTKADSARHGYGIKTIKSIANKYNGTAKFYEESNLFYCQVLMYKSINAKLT